MTKEKKNDGGREREGNEKEREGILPRGWYSESGKRLSATYDALSEHLHRVVLGTRARENFRSFYITNIDTRISELFYIAARQTVR